MIHCGITHHPARQDNSTCEYCDYAASKLQRSTAVAVATAVSTEPVAAQPVGERIRSTAQFSFGDIVTYQNLGKVYRGEIIRIDANRVLVKISPTLSWWVDFDQDDSPENARKGYLGYDLRKAV